MWALAIDSFTKTNTFNLSSSLPPYISVYKHSDLSQQTLIIARTGTMNYTKKDKKKGLLKTKSKICINNTTWFIIKYGVVHLA